MTHWFFDTAGIGSIIVFVVAISVLVAYVRMLRWIQTAPPSSAQPADDPDAAGGKQQ
jgi:hypothetical protein